MILLILEALAAPEDYAVVIANERYPFLAGSLQVPFAYRDGALMQSIFVETLDIDPARVTVLRDARVVSMRAAVDAARAKVLPGGALWVYFGGHGWTLPDSRYALLGSDASSGELATGGVLLEEFAVADGVRTYLLVDSCAGGTGRTGRAITPEGSRPAVPAEVLPEVPALVALTATRPEQFAHPLWPRRHGAFTWLAAGALRGWADGADGSEPDGAVTGGEALIYLDRGFSDLGLDQNAGWGAEIPSTQVRLSSGVRERGPSAASLRWLGARNNRDHASMWLSIVAGGALAGAGAAYTNAWVKRDTFDDPTTTSVELGELRDEVNTSVFVAAGLGVAGAALGTTAFIVGRW